MGRTGSQVKIRGYRIEIEDVERVCSEVPGVKGVCIVAFAQDLRKAAQIVAYVEPLVNEGEATELRTLPSLHHQLPTRVANFRLR